MIQVIPDSRLVEELQKELRAVESSGPNEMNTNLTRMGALIDSGVLQKRGIRSVQVGKTSYLSGFNSNRVPTMNFRGVV